MSVGQPPGRMPFGRAALRSIAIVTLTVLPASCLAGATASQFMSGRQIGGVPLTGAGWLENVLWLVAASLVLVWAWAVNRILKRGEAEVAPAAANGAAPATASTPSPVPEPDSEQAAPADTGSLRQVSDADLAALDRAIDFLCNSGQVTDRTLQTDIGLTRPQARLLLERIVRERTRRRDAANEGMID